MARQRQTSGIPLAHPGFQSKKRQEIPAQALTDELVQVALRRGSSDNVTALVVRVQGALEATLQDESRRAQDLPVLPLLKVGDTVQVMQPPALPIPLGRKMNWNGKRSTTSRPCAATCGAGRVNIPKGFVTERVDCDTSTRADFRATQYHSRPSEGWLSGLKHRS